MFTQCKAQDAHKEKWYAGKLTVNPTWRKQDSSDWESILMGEHFFVKRLGETYLLIEYEVNGNDSFLLTCYGRS